MRMKRLDTWKQANEIKAAADKALAEVAERFGLKYKPVGKWSADAEGLVFKSEFFCTHENGMPAYFERLCAEYQLEPSDYGKVFQGSDREYRLVGINTRSRRQPFICICTRTGKEYMYGPKIPLQNPRGYRARSWVLSLR